MVENEVQWLAKTFYPYRNMAHLTILFAGYLRSPWALLTIFLTELVKRGASDKLPDTYLVYIYVLVI